MSNSSFGATPVAFATDASDSPGGASTESNATAGSRGVESSPKTAGFSATIANAVILGTYSVVSHGMPASSLDSSQ